MFKSRHSFALNSQRFSREKNNILAVMKNSSFLLFHVTVYNLFRSQIGEKRNLHESTLVLPKVNVKLNMNECPLQVVNLGHWKSQGFFLAKKSAR
jgi:hypothetical protein